jgi:RNA polymerase sigma-70 factor (ECF subfamily)
VATVDIERAIDQYFDRIHRAALILTGNPWDADDLAQETFLVLSRESDRFQGRSNLYTWLYGILLNLERQQRRRAGLLRTKLRVLWIGEPSTPRAAPPADTPVEVDEWKRSLWAEVARLPDGQRQSLVLRFSEHLAYEEIAEVLGCPLGTIKSRIHNGLATLRKSLQMQYEAGDEGIVPLWNNKDLGHAV